METVMMEVWDKIRPVLTPLTDVLLVLSVLLATWLIAKVFRRVFSAYLERATDELHVDVTHYFFLKHLITALIYLCGFGIAIYLIEPLRNLSLSLFAGSGIVAVIIGFASQQSLANIVSGIFITIFKPFKVGDRVKLTGQNLIGEVEDITLRHTLIRTYENKRVVVPNSVISTEVIENSNIVDEKICRFIEIGISYDSDMDKAMEIMRDEAMKHPDTLDARKPEDIEEGLPIVKTRVISFGDSSVNLRAWVWAKDQPTGFNLQCELNKAIKERFDREGITIPFPQRDIHIKSGALKSD